MFIVIKHPQICDIVRYQWPKINSIEHLLLVKNNLEAEVANKSAATFCHLGIAFI